MSSAWAPSPTLQAIEGYETAGGEDSGGFSKEESCTVLITKDLNTHTRLWHSATSSPKTSGWTVCTSKSWMDCHVSRLPPIPPRARVRFSISRRLRKNAVYATQSLVSCHSPLPVSCGYGCHQTRAEALRTRAPTSQPRTLPPPPSPYLAADFSAVLGDGRSS